MKSLTASVAILVLFGLVFVGCSTDNPTHSSVDQTTLEKKPVEPTTGEGSFTLEAKYTYIRSYPSGGGGVYLLNIVPGADLTGDVAITVSADKTLGAQLTTAIVNGQITITELTLSPTARAALGIHYITVTASNQTHQESIQLEAELLNWGILSMGTATEKQGEFIDWLGDEHPELGNFSSMQWDMYGTYPGIKIVEHYTYLGDEWEFRICFHVMIPPDDWSQMSLRRRGEWDLTLAARREWDEVAQDYLINEIPVEDYPVYFGY